MIRNSLVNKSIIIVIQVKYFKHWIMDLDNLILHGFVILCFNGKDIAKIEVNDKVAVYSINTGKLTELTAKAVKLRFTIL